jgi:predicted dehydrogenase
LDLGSHTDTLVSFLIGEKPLEVVAVNETYGNFKRIVDNSMCIARYSGQILCTTWFSKTAFGYRNGLKIRIFGSERAAEWIQEFPELVHLADKYGHKYSMDRGSPEAESSKLDRYTRFKVGHPAGFLEAFANYYIDIAEALSIYLAGGDRYAKNEYVFGIDESLSSIKVLEAMAESAAQKRWISIK